MILKDGTDTREETNSPSRMCDGMAVVLDRLVLDGTWDEIQGGEFGGPGGARVGRRILWWDTQGFLSSDRYADDNEASETLNREFPYEDTF